MLKGKCALITGSTQGLGYAMAERLAAEGCHVVLNGFGDPAEIEAKRRAPRRQPWRARPPSWRRPRRAGRDRRPGRDSRARPSGQSTSWSTTPSSGISRRSRTSRSRTGTGRSRSISRRRSMSRASSCPACAGAISAGSSTSPRSTACSARVNRIDYVTTKTALIGFTRAVALEVAGQNITCNAICPGSSPTPAIEQRLAEFMAARGPGARRRGPRLHGLAPALGPVRGDGGRGRSRRLPVRPGRPRHHRRGHSDRRWLERQLTGSGHFLVAIPKTLGLVFPQQIKTGGNANDRHPSTIRPGRRLAGRPGRCLARLRPADQREREVAPDLELPQEPRHALWRGADHRARRSAR